MFIPLMITSTFHQALISQHSVSLMETLFSLKEEEKKKEKRCKEQVQVDAPSLPNGQQREQDVRFTPAHPLCH